VTSLEEFSGSRCTVIIPVRNERTRLPAVIAGLEAQRRPAERVIISDGASDDGSREWLRSVAASRPWLTVLHNERRTISAGLNLALRHASGDLVARMDAHADYTPGYLERLVDHLDSHPDVTAVGALMETAGKSPWGVAIAATLRRPFGMGGAPHRINGKAGPVDHVFTGCYRRSALLAAGGFEERLLTNEDFEMDVRVRRHGGVIWLVNGASSTWHVRESPRALTQQMFRYGFYKALTLRLHPDSLKTRQLAPPAAVAMVLTAILGRSRLATGTALGYLAGVGALGALAARSDSGSAWRGGLVPPLVHLSWGSGLLVGTLRFLSTSRRKLEGAVTGSRS
jgi:GT2 family glycosyltransferase